jgi:hypothetical protein
MELLRNTGKSLLNPIIKLVVGLIILLVLTLRFEAYYPSLQTNRISISLSEYLYENDLSVTNLGLNLFFYNLPSLLIIPEDENICESKSSRLDSRMGIVNLINNNITSAHICFISSFERDSNAADTAILLLTSQFLEKRQGPVNLSRDSILKRVQSIPAINAQEILSLTNNTEEVLNINANPRRILFELWESEPDLAEKFSKVSFKNGFLTPLDIKDLESYSSWIIKERENRISYLSNSPIFLQAESTIEKEIGRHVICKSSKMLRGENILRGGYFSNPGELNEWEILSWTSGSSLQYNQGKYVIGLDNPGNNQSDVSLRISGLWKNESNDKLSAHGSIRSISPIPLMEGDNLYLILIRYRTENIQSGLPIIWLLNRDGQKLFFHNWVLEPSSNWVTVYVLIDIDKSITPIIYPVINNFALGSLWIDHFLFMPFENPDCALLGKETIVEAINENDLWR